MISRSPRRLVLALGMIASILGVSTVFAHDDHEAGNNHDAAKAEKKISEALAPLSAADRKLAETQRFCPMMEHSRLGAMGTPIKLMIEGKPVFVCCKGCVDDAKEHGPATLKMSQQLSEASAVLANFPAKERAAIEAQKYCAIQDKNLLGSMGAPIKLELNGEPVYLCCKGCIAKAKADPNATLAKVKKLTKAGLNDGHDHQH